jgi:hypothetical protein
MFRLARSVSHSLGSFVRLAGDLTLDGLRFLGATLRARSAVSAEILFLRKQLAFYPVRPRRLTDSARFSLVFWSRLFDWKEALVIVKPETLIGWHRKGFKLEMEVSSRQTTTAGEYPPIDSSHGCHSSKHRATVKSTTW